MDRLFGVSRGVRRDDFGRGVRRSGRRTRGRARRHRRTARGAAGGLPAAPDPRHRPLTHTRRRSVMARPVRSKRAWAIAVLRTLTRRSGTHPPAPVRGDATMGFVNSHGLGVRPALDADLPFLRRMLYEAANRPGSPWPAFDASRRRRATSGSGRAGSAKETSASSSRTVVSLSVRHGSGVSRVRNSHPSTTRRSRSSPSVWNGTTEVAVWVVFSWMR
jgi:hypothetical protein